MKIKVSGILSVEASVVRNEQIMTIEVQMTEGQMWDTMLDMMEKFLKEKRAEVIQSLTEAAS